MLRINVVAVLLALSFRAVDGQIPPANTPGNLVQKIQGELSGPPTPDCMPNPNVPHGELIHGQITDSPIYPGTENNFEVYVPAQYDPAKPACLLVKLDGLGVTAVNALDNLIASKELPVIIAVGIAPGAVFKDPPGKPNRAVLRYNRSYEFDSVNGNFADFVLNEVLPAAEKLKTKDGRAINISPDGNDHAATGGSTGGIGSFTLAWQRPDQFTRIYDDIGTFVSMRGGHEYPALIRKTEPKPIRIFLEDGSSDAWNALFGSWYDANLNMESALSFAGYDVGHAWGTHGHDGKPGAVIFPDVMRWLWRDYPAPIKAGVSKNSTVQEITIPGEGWQKIAGLIREGSCGIAANSQGEIYVTAPSETQSADKYVFHLNASGENVPFPSRLSFAAQSFGPDGTLYGIDAINKTITAVDTAGKARTFINDIAGRSITVTHDGNLYVTEPGEHSDMPSKVWLIKPSGEKQVVDEGLSSASGIAPSPDGSLLYVAEHATKWIYSYVIQPDGTLTDKQPYFWLHMDDITGESGAEDLAVDTHGNLYAATRMGIQVCDQNGRVRAILPLPTPCGPVRSLCFGGPQFDELYVTDGTQVFKRKMKVPGLPPWAPRIPPPKSGPS